MFGSTTPCRFSPKNLHESRLNLVARNLAFNEAIRRSLRDVHLGISAKVFEALVPAQIYVVVRNQGLSIREIGIAIISLGGRWTNKKQKKKKSVPSSKLCLFGSE